MLLRHYLEAGLSKSAVARRLGISRDTLHRWVRDGELDRELDGLPVCAQARPPVEGKLGRYQELIRARLEAYPELSAVRLFEEVKAAGYAGSYNRVKVFRQQVCPPPAAEPAVRFETAAGQQAQVDFAPGGHLKFPHLWPGQIPPP